MELNEVGFKFVQKCINCIETKGKSADQELILSVWACVTWPEGGIIESHLSVRADSTPASSSWGKKSPSLHHKSYLMLIITSLEHFDTLMIFLSDYFRINLDFFSLFEP